MTLKGTVEKNAGTDKTNLASKTSPEIKHTNNGSLFSSITGNFAHTPPKGVSGQIQTNITAESGIDKNPFSSSYSSSRSAPTSPEADSFTFMSPPAPLFTPAKPSVTLFTNSVTNSLFTEPKKAPLASLNNNNSNNNNTRLQAGFAELLQRSKISDQSNRTADVAPPGPFSFTDEEISKIDPEIPVFQFNTTGKSFPPSLSKESDFLSNSQAPPPTFTFGSDTGSHKTVNRATKFGKHAKIRLPKQHLASLNQQMAHAPADGGWFWGKDSAAAEKNEEKEQPNPNPTTTDSIPITTTTTSTEMFNFRQPTLGNETVESDKPFSFPSSVPPNQSNSAKPGPFSSDYEFPSTDSAYFAPGSAPLSSSNPAATSGSTFHQFSSSSGSTFSSSHSAAPDTFTAAPVVSGISVSFNIGAKDKTTKTKSKSSIAKSSTTASASLFNANNSTEENPLNNNNNKFGTLPSIHREASNPLSRAFTAPSLFSNDGSQTSHTRS